MKVGTKVICNGYEGSLMYRPAFDSGDRVRCLDAEATFHRLTEGNIYTVERCDGSAVYLLGVRSNHSAERFELVKS
jgi:hypothetical protein